MSITFSHTDIVAKDWRTLADFYIQAFGCKPVGPERDLSGEWLEDLTGIGGLTIRGVHLSLPGCESGPTLEIFGYDPILPRDGEPGINRQGLGHLAFHVDDVEAVTARLLEYGGRTLGKTVKRQYKGLGLLTVVYAEDPEGNFIEIQNWSNPR